MTTEETNKINNFYAQDTRYLNPEQKKEELLTLQQQGRKLTPKQLAILDDIANNRIEWYLSEPATSVFDVQKKIDRISAEDIHTIDLSNFTDDELIQMQNVMDASFKKKGNLSEKEKNLFTLIDRKFNPAKQPTLTIGEQQNIEGQQRNRNMQNIKKTIAEKKEVLKQLTLDRGNARDQQELNSIDSQIGVINLELSDLTDQYNQTLAEQSEAEGKATQTERDTQIDAAIKELMGGQEAEAEALKALRTTGTAKIENQFTTAQKELEDMLLSSSQKYGNIGGGNLARGGLFGAKSAGLANLQTGRIGALSGLETNIQDQARRNAQLRQSQIATAMNILSNQAGSTTTNKRYYDALKRLGYSPTATPQYVQPQQETQWWEPWLDVAGQVGGAYVGSLTGNPLAVGAGASAGKVVTKKIADAFSNRNQPSWR